MRKTMYALALLIGLGAVGPALAGAFCGPQPPAAPGCKVGPCVCDKNGQNCQWTMVCS